MSNDKSPQIKCFLCGRKENVRKFTLKTLNKCLDTLKVRKEQNWRYKDVEIPSELNDSVGYHSRPCYANFTALGQIHSPVKTEKYQDVSSEIIQSDNVSADDSQLMHKCSNNGNICIFCGQLFKKIKGRKHHLMVTTEYSTMDKIKAFATKTNDLKLLQNIHSCVNNTKPIKYHKVCKNNYNSVITTSQKPKTDWHDRRNHFKIALKNLGLFIEYYIIRQRKHCFLDFLLELFLDYLVQSYNDPQLDKYSFSTSHIPEKLKQKFGKEIKIISKPHQRKIVVPKNFDVPIHLQQLTETDVILRSALLLRDTILKINPARITDNITAADFVRGECELPEPVISFFTTFLAGNNLKPRESSRTTRLVKSFGADAIHAVTHGRIRPSKHIMLGSAIKSLTNSKKVIDVLYRYGHICSYDTIRFLETEVTSVMSERSNLCSDLICEKNLFGSTDKEGNEKVTNNDITKIFIKEEITSDEHLLTDNDVLTRRNEFAADERGECLEQLNTSLNVDVISSKKRRIGDIGVIANTPTYLKKPKMTGTLEPNNFNLHNLSPTDLVGIKKIDGLWVLSHVCGIKTPMWFGFNLKLFKDYHKEQKVSYVTPINQSPIDKAVMLDNMRRALTIARECNEPYAQVTYDLGMAKIAMSLQREEKEKFNNLFIHLDASHIMMALFKAIGSFIDGSGLPTVMVESELIDTGSISFFLSGQNVSRCKRLHTLIALCLQMQEFKLFLRKANIVLDKNIQNYLQKVQSEPPENYNIKNENVNDLVLKFLQFHEEVLSGLHGKTAQYYSLYIQFIQYFLIFERSIRTANYELYVYVIAKINNLFFSFNQFSYARWLACYNETLIGIDGTHPGLKEKLVFGVKRTEKIFSRNHSFQSFIISHVFNDCGLKKQDGTDDLQINRIKKSKIHIDTFIETLNRRINPFCSPIEENLLYNISTGQAASKDVETFLLNVEKEGEKNRKIFSDACNEDKENFDNYVIKNNSIINFASAVKPKKIKIGVRYQNVKMQGDFFGKLLDILLKNEIDLAKILSYPLTPVPLSLCHLDETMMKTDGSKLTKILEQHIEGHSLPQSIDVLIIDGFFFVSQLGRLPQTFGQIAIHILRVITESTIARQIYLVFDEYCKPSIKDPEHALGCVVSRDFCITGPEQVLPADFRSEMKNYKFKKAFVSFIMDYWGHFEATRLLGDKNVFVSFDKCHKYSAASGSVNMPQYRCVEHKDANTKIAFFLSKINDSKNIVIRCLATDILVICLGNIKHFAASIRIWIQFECGNNVRFINVSDLYTTLGNSLCAALPAFHAFTGCNLNPSFYKKEKKKAFYLLKNSSDYQTAFANIEDENSYSMIEKFVCEMYTTQSNGLKNIVKVNDARLKLFLIHHSTLEDLKSSKKNTIQFDACLIPPCSRELKQHILRTKYISASWSNAHLQKPTALNPLEHGWKVSNGAYEFYWFDGDQAPELEKDVQTDDGEKDDQINEDIATMMDDEEYDSGEEEEAEDLSESEIDFKLDESDENDDGTQETEQSYINIGEVVLEDDIKQEVEHDVFADTLDNLLITNKDLLTVVSPKDSEAITPVNLVKKEPDSEDENDPPKKRNRLESGQISNDLDQPGPSRLATTDEP